MAPNLARAGPGGAPARRGPVSLAGLAFALTLVTGCSGAGSGAGSGSGPVEGGGSVEATARPTPAPAAGATTSPSPSPLDEDVSDLAEAAEQAASRAPVPTGSAEPVLGADISWPQCPPGMGIPEKRTLGMPLPVPEARYVVIGLTNGPGFVANPCLADQVDLVRRGRRLAAAYAVASYPDAAAVATYGARGPFDAQTPAGRLQNVGYQQARFNIDSMRAAGLLTPVVWVDVEPVADFEWSADPVANAAVVTGAVRGYADAGYEVGVYSTPYLWEGVVGDLELGLPEWRAAGQTSRAEALSRCGEEWVVQGGAAVLAQWVEARRDQNLTCPGIAVDLGRWFHQY